MLETFINGYKGYFNYVLSELSFQTSPWWKNYILWLVIVSLLFLSLEYLNPWRKEQPLLRRDFWLDIFYNCFNFFLFSIIIYNAASSVVVDWVNGGIFALTGVAIQQLNPMLGLPAWAVLLIGFVVRDFVQWNTHRLLHSWPLLWQFHKVHHSTQEMGWGAHLRYHWMETIVYRTVEYLPLALLGIGLHDFFIIHIFAITVGHYNHSNFYLAPQWKGLAFGAALGLFVGIWVLDAQGFGLVAVSALLGAVVGFLLKDLWSYVFNSPEMHIWHHAKELPAERQTGVNFGLTLAVWDYLFRTNYQPYHGRDIALGFDHVEDFPQEFAAQAFYGFKK